MAKYTATDIKALRELTGAGMLDCKKALDESDGEMQRAVEILRVKGAKDVGKRTQRTASNGLVTARLQGTVEGVLLEVNCETDFVAKTAGFQSLADGLVETIAQAGPADVEALLDVAFAAEPRRTVREVIESTGASLGEKIEVRRFVRFDDGYVAAYLHKSSPDLPPTVGVLVELDQEQPEVAKDLAQHIAAMSPKYVSRDDVPDETVDSERRIAEATARQEGKPEQALAKIIDGRVNGFFKDFTLLEQPFVKDNKKTIRQVLDGAGVSVRRFARFKVGQA
ncbi:MAG: translation elongation factor Ts [Pseudonocardiales bacterium]